MICTVTVFQLPTTVDGQQSAVGLLRWIEKPVLLSVVLLTLKQRAEFK